MRGGDAEQVALFAISSKALGPWAASCRKLVLDSRDKGSCYAVPGRASGFYVPRAVVNAIDPAVPGELPAPGSAFIT